MRNGTFMQSDVSRIARHLVFAATAFLVLSAAPSVFAQTATSILERVSSFEYDADGLLIQEVVEPDRPNDCLQTVYSWDAYGNRSGSSSSACAGASGHAITSATAPRSSATSFDGLTVVVSGLSYTAPAGVFPTSSQNALAQTEQKQFDPRHGGMTYLRGPNGLITQWTYDAFGRKTSENRADGSYTNWVYKLCQLEGQPRDPLCPLSVGSHSVRWYISEASYDQTATLLGPIKYVFHDVMDRVVRSQTQDFQGQVVVEDTHYNPLGQVSQRSIPHRLSDNTPHWTTFTYDHLGRVTSEVSPDGNGGTAVAQTAYNGLVTIATNPLGQTKTTQRDVAGQTIKVVDHLGSEVLYSYDALGQLLRTNAAGVVTQMDYNRRGQKQSMQDPAMGAWNYAYNVYGELVWQQDSLSQTTTIAYDVLGRITQRTEPDLVSQWYYDRDSNGLNCGAGVGKLCEATSNNGYRRVHAYDALGRPIRTETVLDSATSPAVLSYAYDSQTGRLARQTWPTGYQAAYSYNAFGFLRQVDGGGVNGHTQTVSLEVLAMDPQGRVTQYRQGNNVTTVKAYDQPTGKLNSVQATLQGQGVGNVLNHSYNLDKLGNLLVRADANSGVSETFQYDALNRLTLYTALGGGIGSAQSVQALYDPAGNLKYKSDTGYYHYDPSRPSRLNHITLAPESGWSATGTVTLANTGTRALSYAFDDGRSGARSITTPSGSQTMGNGNLWYTVSQDQTNGRHTVRWETYTSFNAPREILFGNLAPAQNYTPATINGYECPPGYDLSGTTCSRLQTSSFPATPAYTCPSGFTLNGSMCVRNNSAPAIAYCSAGSSMLNGTCQAWTSPQVCAQIASAHGGVVLQWPVGDDSSDHGACSTSVGYSCPAGATRSGSQCLSTTTQSAGISSYSCPAGAVLSGSTCSSSVFPATPSYACPAGFSLSGTTCTRNNTFAATPYCSAGSSLIGGTCQAWTSPAMCSQIAAAHGGTVTQWPVGDDSSDHGGCSTTPGYSCPAGATRSGSMCYSTTTQAASVASYSCPAGSILNGSSCQSNTVLTEPAKPIYACAPGTTVTGSNCFNPLATVADRTLSFVYGPEHQRVRQTVELTSNAPSHMEAGTTWYLNGTDSQGLAYEKEVKSNGTIEHKHYVSAGGMSFALYVKREGSLNGKPEVSVSYFHHDHLGSIAATTDALGAVTERLAYDPWGRRRAANGQTDIHDALYGVNTDRGYTMHEHLDEMGVIHMNGRIYDPLIGRFMSADPFIQDGGNLQSYNRYAYVLNNPLVHTDPSGYFSLKKFFKSSLKFALAPTAKNSFNFVAAHPGQRQVDNFIMSNEWAYSLGQIAATVFSAPCGGCGGAIWASYYTYQSTGSMTAAAKAGGIAYGTAVAFTWAGGFGQGAAKYSFAHFGAHALVGCASSVAQGGECGSGALSAATGLAGSAGGFVGSVVAGGVGSVIGGGKFENGAVTGAFGYLFNHCSSGPSCWEGAQRQVGKLAEDIGNAFKDFVWALAPGSGLVDCASGGCGAIAWGVAAVDVLPGTGKAASKFFEGAQYTSKVLGQATRSDIVHGFPQAVDGLAATYGTHSVRVGGDGRLYEWLTVRGEYRGREGTFEYIKSSEGKINHRAFQPD